MLPLSIAKSQELKIVMPDSTSVDEASAKETRFLVVLTVSESKLHNALLKLGYSLPN